MRPRIEGGHLTGKLTGPSQDLPLGSAEKTEARPSDQAFCTPRAPGHAADPLQPARTPKTSLWKRKPKAPSSWRLGALLSSQITFAILEWLDPTQALTSLMAQLGGPPPKIEVTTLLPQETHHTRHGLKSSFLGIFFSSASACRNLPGRLRRPKESNTKFQTRRTPNLGNHKDGKQTRVKQGHNLTMQWMVVADQCEGRKTS